MSGRRGQEVRQRDGETAVLELLLGHDDLAIKIGAALRVPEAVFSLVADYVPAE